MTTKKLTKLLALCLPYILLGLVATDLGVYAIVVAMIIYAVVKIGRAHV